MMGMIALVMPAMIQGVASSGLTTNSLTLVSWFTSTLSVECQSVSMFGYSTFSPEFETLGEGEEIMTAGQQPGKVARRRPLSNKVKMGLMRKCKR